MHNPFIPGWPGFFGTFSAILGAFIGFLLFAAVVVVLFFLVRFLLIGTRAAQLYVNEHAPQTPAPVSPVVSADSTADVGSEVPGPVGAEKVDDTKKLDTASESAAGSTGVTATAAKPATVRKPATRSTRTAATPTATAPTTPLPATPPATKPRTPRTPKSPPTASA